MKGQMIESTDVKTIQKAIERAYKKVSKRQVFRYLKGAGVEPITRMSRPRMFPVDASQRILEWLRVPKMPSLAQLRAVRRRSSQAQRRAA